MVKSSGVVLTKRIPTFLGWFGTATAGLALAMYAYLGIFSRMYADDFCVSGLAVRNGFWSAQWLQYVTWSNRFAGMFLLTASDLIGTWFIRIWPMLILLVWVLGLYWAFLQTDRLLHLSAPKWMIFLLTEWIILFSILFAPELYQSLFWRVGAITYTLPLAFMALLHGMIAKGTLERQTGHKSWGWLAGAGLLAFFAGGFSETYLALQTCYLVSMLLMVFVKRFDRDWRRASGWCVSVALIGSLVSLVVVLLAPGNAVRQGFMPPTPSLIEFIKMDVVNAFLFLYISFKSNAFQALLALIAPMLAFYLYFTDSGISRTWRPSSLIFGLLVAPIVGFLAVGVVMAPAAYVQSSYPDGRVLIIASFLLGLLLVIEGGLLGLILSQLHLLADEGMPARLRVLSAFLAISFFCYPLYDAAKSYRLVPEYRAMAIAWDERNATILAAKSNGQDHIDVMSLNPPGDMSDLRVDLHSWVNICMATYYDVGSISATP